MVVLEGPHLLELLLDPSPAFKRQFQDFLQFLRGGLAMGIDDLHQAGDTFAHRLSVPRIEVGAQAEIPVDDFGVIVLAQGPQGLGPDSPPRIRSAW